jgi:hypothetical protein
VPDEQSFTGRKVRDEAAEVPADYAPPTFQARALQHTSVKLTWDADDDGRKQALSRRLTAEELKEDDFKVRVGMGGCMAALLFALSVPAVLGFPACSSNGSPTAIEQ